MQKKELSDQELIQKIRKDADQAALTELIRRYRSDCRRFLFGICNGDSFLIDEAEQEVFISLEKCLARYRGESSFRTFLYSYVRHKGIDVLRAHRRKATLSLSWLAESGKEEADPTPGPEEQYLQRETVQDKREQLVRLLAALKEEERTVLVLKDQEGLSYEEISQILGRPIGTVRSRLHRARIKAADLIRRGV
jgi:RNA polymerase sigma-70 factor (ECF subfamily)